MHLSDAIAVLKAAGIEDAALEAQIIFETFGGIPRYRMLGCDPACDDAHIESALARRTLREPLAYIIGETYFRGERYRVSPDVLIPRPDTEVLVERAIALLPPHAHFLDLCTGSGCVAISVLTARPDCTAHAYDLSEKALAVAEENAHINGVSSRVVFSQSDLLHERVPTNGARFILSNPPYIAPNEMPTLSPELAFEPRIALEAEENGLLFYRVFLQAYGEALKDGGFFLFEIGHTQAEMLAALARDADYGATFTRDLAGKQRVALCRAL